MKKTLYITLLLCLSIFLFPAQQAFAQSISIYYNSELLQYEKQPILRDSYVYIPIDGYMGVLGYETTWDKYSKVVTLKKNDITISMTINKTTAMKNNTPITLDCPPIILNSNVMLPLRFVAENAGAVLSWDGEKQRADLIIPKSEIFKLTQSIVTIYTDHTQGSGIILSADGLIATNFHVLDNVTKMRIAFANGDSYIGSIYLAGYDAPNDIAILKIDKTGLSPVIFGRPSNQLGKGAEVIAIGSPLGQVNTVSHGVILETGSQVISTTAAIDVGSSGGGLFDKNGMLLGMTSLFKEDDYFSIPCEMIAAVPINAHLPLNEIKNITIPLVPPQNISSKIVDDNIQVSWEPRVGVDYYSVYLSSFPDKNYSKMDNPLFGSNKWYWDFPYCYGMATTRKGDLYIKISSTADGVESTLSDPIKLK